MNKKYGYRQLNVRQLGSLRPWDHRGKRYMDRKRIQCLSNASQHVHTYLQPFTSYSEILVGNRNFFLPPLHLTPPYGVAPGTIAVNVTRLERGFNACKTPRCIYPSIFNRFPVIQAWSLKIRHFSTFWHILAYPRYAPGTIAVNVTWMERGFNAGQTHSSICPSIFNRLRAIARCWSGATFFLPLAFKMIQCLWMYSRCSHWNSGKMFGSQKTRIMGLPKWSCIA